jgi:uncharacterized protein (TIGR03435 family)
VLLGVAVIAALTPSILIGVAFAAAPNGRTQGQNAMTNVPTYEVVSIKPTPPSKSGSGNGLSGSGIQYTADGLRASSTVMSLIQSAYGVDAERIRGAQGWVTSDKFVIEAKLESAVADQLNKLSPEELDAARQHMLQTLLAERFKLVAHSESKELPVYELVVAKNGPKLRTATPGDTYPDGIKGTNGKGLGGDLMVGFGMGKVVAQGVDIASFAHGLERFLKRPVVDKTGLTGRYDFTVHYARDVTQAHPPTDGAVDGVQDSGEPSLFTALQEQLGLKLDAKKDPLAVIVIDRVERPSGN